MGLGVPSLKTSSSVPSQELCNQKKTSGYYNICWELKLLVSSIRLSAVILSLPHLALGNKTYALFLRVGQRPAHMGLESAREKNMMTCLVKNFMQVDLLKLKKKKSETHTPVQIETPDHCQPMKSSNNWLRQPPHPCLCEQLIIFIPLRLLPTFPSSDTREQA